MSSKKTRQRAILNVGFGVLNPLNDTIAGKNFDSQNTTSLGAVRQATSDHFAESLLKTAGKFIGIVLRVDGTVREGAIDPSHWSASNTFMVKKDSRYEIPNLQQVRVRIPELHAHLPVPEFLPSGDDFSAKAKKAHDIINMYPCFVAASEELTEKGPPDLASLVWVDFQNRATFQGPIYLDKIEHDVRILSDSGEVVEAKERFAGEATVGGVGVATESTDIPESGTTVQIGIGQPIIINPKRYTINRWLGGQVSKTRSRRVKLLAYGRIDKEIVAKSGKTTTKMEKSFVTPELLPSNMQYAGRSEEVHPLLIPRLRQLNEIWGMYYDYHGLASVNVPDSPGLPGKGRPYQRNLTISSGVRGTFSPTFAGLRALCQTGYEMSPPRTCREQRRFRSCFSPHMTGLAVDFRGNGLNTSSALIEKHVLTHTYQFLRLYAWLCGFYPLKTETWHYECVIPRLSWLTGEEFINNPKFKTEELPILRAVSSGSPPSSPDSGYVDLSGPDYDFLEGEEFPYAVEVSEWIYEGGKKVFTTSDKFTASYNDSIKGKETFSLPKIRLKWDDMKSLRTAYEAEKAKGLVESFFPTDDGSGGGTSGGGVGSIYDELYGGGGPPDGVKLIEDTEEK